MRGKRSNRQEIGWRWEQKEWIEFCLKEEEIVPERDIEVEREGFVGDVPEKVEMNVESVGIEVDVDVDVVAKSKSQKDCDSKEKEDREKRVDWETVNWRL